MDGERELPAGWAWVRLDQVCDVTGGIQKQAKRRPVENKFPFLRVANVGRGSLDLWDVHEIELFDGELERFRLEPGDLLVVEGNGSPEQIGRAAMWRGAIKDAVHQNHLIKVRPTSVIDPRFLELLWNSPDISAQLTRVAQSTSGLYTLSTSKLNRVEFGLPPLAEQHRIVEVLEEQLSRLDVAEREVHRSVHRVSRVWDSVRNAAAQGGLNGFSANSRDYRVDEIATVSGGIQKQKKRIPVENKFPFLRVANVGAGELDLAEMHEIELFDGELEKHRVEKGDLLVVEGNGSPGQIGRAAMWHGQICDAVHQNHLIRVRPSRQILPEYLELIWNSP
ncbi:restriction endonuclease subunit S [Streptomyces lasalocidi]